MSAARRARRFLAWGCVAVALFVAGWWSSASLARPPAAHGADRTTSITTKVVRGRVEETMRAVTRAEWQARQSLRAGDSCTVTSLGATGSSLDVGDVLFTCDLRPVVLAAGAVPAFRTMAPGMAGGDVAQLQTFLSGQGLWRGPHDGTFTAALSRSVDTWQRGLGVDATGVVGPGDLVFVQTLPAHVALASEVTVGAEVTRGQEIASALDPNPTFTLQLTETQSTSVAAGTEVLITGPTESWRGHIGPVTLASASGGSSGGDEASSRFEAVVVGDDGTAPCKDQCTSLPASSVSQLPTVVVVRPTVEGLIVPLASVVHGPGTTTAVICGDGRRRVVTVVAVGSGWAVIKGLAEGSRVQVTGPQPVR